MLWTGIVRLVRQGIGNRVVVGDQVEVRYFDLLVTRPIFLGFIPQKHPIVVDFDRLGMYGGFTILADTRAMERSPLLGAP
jgi:hypothetical protein